MKFKHCFQRAAAVMASLMLFCSAASAAGAARPSYKQLTAAELQKTCSITLNYTTQNTENPQPLPQTAFRLYRVADMNEDLQFTLTETFADQEKYPVFEKDAQGHLKINSQGYNDWASLASTLANYVAEHKPDPTATITTDAEGKGTASGLPVGLYFMTGERSSMNGRYYDPSPALIALPFWTDGAWNFDAANSAVKYTDREIPSTGPNNPSTPTVERRVLKVWEDEGNEDARPGQITVNLLRDGEVYETVTLSAANNWRASWENLDANSQWQLTESLVSEDYVVSIEQQGVTFVVTNTFVQEIVEENPPLIDSPDLPDSSETPGNPGGPNEPGEPDDPAIDIDIDIDIDDPDVPLVDLPQTGQLWWPVPLLAVGGVAMILAGLVRRRNGSYDA